MHVQLKAMLLDTEVIWIYDEPHQCSIIQQTYKNGRTFYCLMFYCKSISEWLPIHIEETDIHGAQFMYETFLRCFKKHHSAD